MKQTSSQHVRYMQVHVGTYTVIAFKETVTTSGPAVGEVKLIYIQEALKKESGKTR